MSQGLAASSQANQREIDALLGEIAFQKVLLSSIDDSVENREEAEGEVRVEIKNLEKQVRALRRGPCTTTSASQSTTIQSQPIASRSSTSNSRNDTAMDHFSAAGSQNGYQGTLAEIYFFCCTSYIGPHLKNHRDTFHFTLIYSNSLERCLTLK